MRSFDRLLSDERKAGAARFERQHRNEMAVRPVGG